MYYFMFLTLTACCIICVGTLIYFWSFNPMLDLIFGILSILSGSMAFWYFDNRDSNNNKNYYNS